LAGWYAHEYGKRLVGNKLFMQSVYRTAYTLFLFIPHFSQINSLFFRINYAKFIEFLHPFSRNTRNSSIFLMVGSILLPEVLTSQPLLFPMEFYTKRLFLSFLGYKETIAGFSLRSVLRHQDAHYNSLLTMVQGDAQCHSHTTLLMLVPEF
jgi:hypothetical protein